LIASLKEGEAQEARQWPAARCGCERERGKGVGWRRKGVLTGGAQRSARERGEEGEDGPLRGIEPGPGEAGRRPGAVLGLEKKGRESWAGLETGKGQRENVEGFVFLNLFKSFSNFKLFSKFKHFKPFASFRIILKSFKTSHPHSKTPCKQNMMHKHLLPLKLFKSDIKYF
jgi:hypothetical protein